MFCKLFGPDDDQVLLRRGSDEKGQPSVEIHFMPPGMDEPCIIYLAWSDTPEGHEAADERLRSFTEAEARDWIRQANARMKSMASTH